MSCLGIIDKSSDGIILAIAAHWHEIAHFDRGRDIAETGATGPKEMGKVMGVASKRLAGRADGRAVSEMVKQLLNS